MSRTSTAPAYDLEALVAHVYQRGGPRVNVTPEDQQHIRELVTLRIVAIAQDMSGMGAEDAERILDLRGTMENPGWVLYNGATHVCGYVAFALASIREEWAEIVEHSDDPDSVRRGSLDPIDRVLGAAAAKVLDAAA